jgi:heme/copper-type cytochrome/quinol oxidase subunit 2
MVCLGNICINTLQKGDDVDDDMMMMMMMIIITIIIIIIIIYLTANGLSSGGSGYNACT